MEVCSGVLGPVDLKEGEGGLESVVRFARHIFLGNTRDGGMGVWVAGPRWRGWADGEVFEVPEAGEGGGVVGGGGSGGGGKRRLRGYCHCRGVEFYVTPPDDEEEDKHAEFSSGAEKKVFSSTLLALSFFSSPILILHLTSISHLTDTHTGPAMVPPRLRNQIPRRSLRLQFLPSSHGPRPPILGLHPPFPHPPSRWHRFQSPPRRVRRVRRVRREGKHHNDNDIKNVFAYPRREAGVLRAVRRDGVLVA